MTRALDELLDALYRSALVDQFAVVERAGTGVEARMTRGPNAVVRGQREWRDHTLDLALYRDLENGRGSARVRLNQERGLGQDRSWRERVAHWAELAAATLEPPWSLPPPAAPARVDIADLALAADLHAGADAIMSELQAVAEAATPEPLQVQDARVECRAQTVEVRNSHDFRHAYQATTVTIELTLARAVPAASTGERQVERVRVRARRPADLQLAEVIPRAAGRLAERARATPVPAGVYDVVLERDALTPLTLPDIWTEAADTGDLFASRGPSADPDYAWFAPLVAHADSRWARHGLTRYQPGQSIYGRRPRTGDPLTVICDNTIAYGLHSRPLGELGAPTRRFILIQGGVAAGLSLGLREAALRGLPANGGIGNLQVALGARGEDELARPDARPVIRVRAIDHLDIDTPSGAFTAVIGLGHISGPGGPRQPVTGGVMRGNIFDLLAGARLSSTPHASGWYHGPSAIRLHELAMA